jgi:hypothetical protein
MAGRVKAINETKELCEKCQPVSVHIQTDEMQVYSTIDAIYNSDYLVEGNRFYVLEEQKEFIVQNNKGKLVIKPFDC